MKATIHKQQLRLVETQTISDFNIAEDGILDIQVQGGVICVWYLCYTSDDNTGTKKRSEVTLVMKGTGDGIPLNEFHHYTFIKTVQLNGYVWHFFTKKA